MAVPDYQAFMLVLLRSLSDGKEHRIGELYVPLADELGLSPEARRDLLPSGKQPVYQNRIGWAKTYLLKAGLLECPRRGISKITERGRSILKRQPKRINAKLLSEFPEFVDFKSKKRGDQTTKSVEPPPILDDQSPDEALEQAYREIRKTLASDLLAEVMRASSDFFERLVIDLIVGMGYGGSREDAGQVVGRSGDEGIDGIINEDRLGLDVIYLQAKRWEGPVSRPEIQKFVGALQGRRAKKGVFITTSSFTREATNYVGSIDSKVVLIDGERLTELMIDFDIGVSPVDTFITKRIDTDYFEEG